jgi:hypothetical protein
MAYDKLGESLFTQSTIIIIFYDSVSVLRTLDEASRTSTGKGKAVLVLCNPKNFGSCSSICQSQKGFWKFFLRDSSALEG